MPPQLGWQWQVPFTQAPCPEQFALKGSKYPGQRLGYEQSAPSHIGSHMHVPFKQVPCCEQSPGQPAIKLLDAILQACPEKKGSQVQMPFMQLPWPEQPPGHSDLDTEYVSLPI